MFPAPLALRRDPIEVLTCLAEEPGACLLEVPDPAHPVTLVACRPVEEFRSDNGGRDSLAAMVRFLSSSSAGNPSLPFPLGGGVVACLTYELGVRLAPRRIAHGTPGPLVVLRRYDPLLVHDRRRGQW